mgnify:CR=1 FL=1
MRSAFALRIISGNGAVNFYGNSFTVSKEKSTDPSIRIASVYFDLCQCGKGRWVIGFDELIQFQTGDPDTVQIKPLSFGGLLQGKDMPFAQKTPLFSK